MKTEAVIVVLVSLFVLSFLAGTIFVRSAYAENQASLRKPYR